MAEILRIDRELISGFEPQRPEIGHKNTFGTVLICAGSEYMTGAAVMAAGSALRSGAGLVKVFSDEKTLDAIRFNEPCALLEARPDETSGLLRKASALLKNADSALLGPGMPGDYKDMEALTALFIEKSEHLVLDAGAFTDKADVLARFKERLRARSVPAVITPHPGEFARLTGLSKSEVAEKGAEAASSFSAENNAVVVLKGSSTVIAVPDGRIFINEAPNSGLAKGGSGDVLAGLTAGLLAQGMEPYRAACSAVYIHSEAGKAALEDIGARAMLPTDNINYLPEGYLNAGWR
ncbi:MAG: NAD(P)H-hydrate dehydratase [Clostridiales bacterium]|nr:NAD(P)H-hydrate dehydratase [Clostridiales bacterium]